MEHIPGRRRNPWIDFALITFILALTGAIVFFITSEDGKAFSHSQKTAAGSPIDSTVTKESSTFPEVLVVTEKSTERSVPFFIQYPQIEDEKFNTIIEDYIQKSKKSYINDMLKSKNKDGNTSPPAALTIQLDTYQHNGKYFSFVFTEHISKNDKDIKTNIKTIFYDKENARTIDIRTLLGEDINSLETLSHHIRTRLKTSPTSRRSIWPDKVDLATEPRWVLFDQFAISHNELIIYFDAGMIAPAKEGPLSINVSLSFLNPLLASDFQQPIGTTETPPASQGNEQKRVALTFDDGPHPEVTLQILQCLERYHAKATFFMLGNRVQHYPDIARKVKDAGHELGNHTWSHPVLTKLTAAQVMNEFATTEEAIFNATGQEATVFRPPYGATNEAIEQNLPRDGILWSIDTLDWKHKNADKVVAMVKQQIHNNAIILMHDIHQSTADALPAVLEFLSKEGYEFVTVSEILPYH